MKKKKNQIKNTLNNSKCKRTDKEHQLALCHSCCRGPVLLKLSWIFRLARRPIKKPSVSGYAGLGWGRVNFIHSSLYGAVLFICGGKGLENSGVFSWLLSCAYRESRPFLLVSQPHQQAGWGGTKSFFRAEGEGWRGRKGEHLEFPRRTSFTSFLHCSWLNTCLLTGISEWIPCFAFLVCECYLFYLLNCFHLNPQVLFFTLLILSPQPTWGGVSECPSGVCLPAGIELQHGSVNGLDAFKLFLNWQLKCMLKSQSCCSKINLTFKTHSKPHPALVSEGRKKKNPKHLHVCLMEDDFSVGYSWDKR